VSETVTNLTYDRGVREYLEPGVYVEEENFRSKPIDGVATAARCFLGPFRRGINSAVKTLVTGFLLGTAAAIALDRARHRRRPELP